MEKTKYDIEDLKQYLFSPDQSNIEVAFTMAPEQCQEICSQFQWLVDLGYIDECREALSFAKLRLENNQLTKLPESIGNLTNLTKLHLWNNQLAKLPDSIGNLTKLRWLDLGNNKLAKLPDSIGNLTNLTWLHLWGNRLANYEKERIRRALPNCEIYF